MSERSWKSIAREAFEAWDSGRRGLELYDGFMAGFEAAWDRRAEPPCPPEVDRLASAARALLDRYDANNFPEDWQELEVALAPFERLAGDDGKNS